MNTNIYSMLHDEYLKQKPELEDTLLLMHYGNCDKLDRRLSLTPLLLLPLSPLEVGFLKSSCEFPQQCLGQSRR